MTRVSTLWALRIYGPITSCELSRRTATDRHTAILKAEALAGRSLAYRLEDGRWDVTEAGRTAAPARIDAPAERTRALKLADAPAERKLCRWPYPPRRPA
jgi:hypothetical protein